MADSPQDMDFLDAKDALEACARAVLSGQQSGPLMQAFKLVDLSWDNAPKRKKFGKKRPESQEELKKAFQQPCGDWLPYAEDLNAKTHTLMDAAGQPTQFCKFINIPEKPPGL